MQLSLKLTHSFIWRVYFHFKKLLLVLLICCAMSILEFFPVTRPRASGSIFGMEWVETSGLSVFPVHPAKASLCGLWPRMAECSGSNHMKAEGTGALLTIGVFSVLHDPRGWPY